MFLSHILIYFLMSSQYHNYCRFKTSKSSIYFLRLWSFEKFPVFHRDSMDFSMKSKPTIYILCFFSSIKLLIPFQIPFPLKISNRPTVEFGHASFRNCKNCPHFLYWCWSQTIQLYIIVPHICVSALGRWGGVKAIGRGRGSHHDIRSWKERGRNSLAVFLTEFLSKFFWKA